MIDATCIARGPARYEVHAIEMRIAGGRRAPSRSAILTRIAVLEADLGATAHVILAQERMGHDEYQVTVVFFWREDGDPT